MKRFGAVLALLYMMNCHFTPENAARVVWHDVYKIQTCPLPKLVWEIPAFGFPCLDYDHGRCVSGRYVPWSNTIYFILDGRLHDSALSHELFHAALVCWGMQSGDPKHLSSAWPVVDTANTHLSETGWY